MVLALLSCTAALLGGGGKIWRAAQRAPRPSPLLLLEGEDFTMGALRQELARRGGEGSGPRLEFQPGLGRFAKMQQMGPHHTTTPREVVEYVITKLKEKDVAEAFTFTCIPVTKRGCHKSSTDWTRRMAWERAHVIGGAPSGKALAAPEFEEMLRSTYSGLLETAGYRFLGDASAWQQQNGAQEMTAVKEYVVEVKTVRDEHLLVKFKLVYDWLLYCHLIATVQLFAMSSSKAFPGTEDIDLDI